ncbi:MAG: hypothetical protein AAGF23_02945 [Acidobacteriota bacterium]
MGDGRGARRRHVVEADFDRCPDLAAAHQQRALEVPGAVPRQVVRHFGERQQRHQLADVGRLQLVVEATGAVQQAVRTRGEQALAGVHEVRRLRVDRAVVHAQREGAAQGHAGSVRVGGQGHFRPAVAGAAPAQRAPVDHVPRHARRQPVHRDALVRQDVVEPELFEAQVHGQRPAGLAHFHADRAAHAAAGVARAVELQPDAEAVREELARDVAEHAVPEHQTARLDGAAPPHRPGSPAVGAVEVEIAAQRPEVAELLEEGSARRAAGLEAALAILPRRPRARAVERKVDAVAVDLGLLHHESPGVELSLRRHRHPHRPRRRQGDQDVPYAQAPLEVAVPQAPEAGPEIRRVELEGDLAVVERQLSADDLDLIDEHLEGLPIAATADLEDIVAAAPEEAQVHLRPLHPDQAQVQLPPLEGEELGFEEGVGRAQERRRLLRGRPAVPAFRIHGQPGRFCGQPGDLETAQLHRERQ